MNKRFRVSGVGLVAGRATNFMKSPTGREEMRFARLKPGTRNLNPILGSLNMRSAQQPAFADNAQGPGKNNASGKHIRQVDNR